MASSTPTSSDAPGPCRSVSIVLPTFNRLERLRRVLAALEVQTFAGPAEVIVVSDGSTDGTDDFLAEYDTSLDVVVVRQENAGPAAARNRGIARARHDLVIFLDDDVIPDRDLIEEHIRAQNRAGPGAVVIGPMLSPHDADYSPWVAWEQKQLQAQYAWLSEAGDATYRQFYTGNASVARSLLDSVRGFDEDFTRAEDVELAFRLRRAGSTFVFCPTARAYHYAERSFESWRSMAHHYGRNVVEFERRGHDFYVKPIAQEFWERHWIQRWTVRLLTGHDGLTRSAVSVMTQVAVISWRLRAKRVAYAALSAVYGIEFYRGLADELGGHMELMSLLRHRWRDRDAWCAVFVLEQTLGHVTHAKNLRASLSDRHDVDIDYVHVEPERDGVKRSIPLWSNWTVQAGMKARQGVRRLLVARGRDRVHAIFVHSQVPAVFMGRLMRRIPTVVSLDATPLQYDSLGESYGHQSSRRAVEAVKLEINKRCFGRARHLVTWSAWARSGLIADYEVPPEKVTVIPPGVDLSVWSRDRASDARPETVGVLFVGGDFERKGGALLVEAVRRLRSETGMPSFEVHVVTTTDSADFVDDIVVHLGMTPNSAELIALYHRCEIFCLPTRGDCLPMVLAEAGAAELALISSDVGAISEVVRDGETGRIVEVGDLDGLCSALEELIRDPTTRRKYGQAAGELVRRDHDARRNAHRLLDLVASVGDWSLPLPVTE